MNRESIVLLFLASAAFAQKEAPKFTVGFEDGTVIGFHTESSGANSLLSTSGSVEVAAGHEAYRFVLDKEDHVIFGYSIEARKLGQGKFAVRIKPLNQEKVHVESRFLQRRSTGDIPTLASARDFPPLRAGDAVQIDILYHPGTGEKLYDVLKVVGERPPSDRAPNHPAGELFSLREFRVDINGKTIQEPETIWMIGGGLSIYVPGRGDFYLGLSPCPGSIPCTASGWADHNVLRFHAGDELVEVVAKSNVLQNSDYRTIWVYHDPESEGRAAEGRGVEFTCGDDMESLIRLRKQKGN
jgi:hypothetical protein